MMNQNGYNINSIMPSSYHSVLIVHPPLTKDLIINNSLITYTTTNLEVTRQDIKFCVEYINLIYGYINLRYYIKI